MGWIGVDLDGVLAEYHGWPADGSIGKPVPAMVERVKAWLAEGKDVRIFTARGWPLGTTEEYATGGTALATLERLTQAQNQAEKICAWSEQHLGQRLRITCVKDHSMIELWDDRAVQVVPNTGLPALDHEQSLAAACLRMFPVHGRIVRIPGA